MASFFKFNEYLLKNFSRQLTQAYVRLILCAPSSQESDLQPDKQKNYISFVFKLRLCFRWRPRRHDDFDLPSLPPKTSRACRDQGRESLEEGGQTQPIGNTWLGKTKTIIGSSLRLKHSNKHSLLGEQQSVIFMCTKSVISKLFAIF